jgi:hypothetical protein
VFRVAVCPSSIRDASFLKVKKKNISVIMNEDDLESAFMSRYASIYYFEGDKF